MKQNKLKNTKHKVNQVFLRGKYHGNEAFNSLLSMNTGHEGATSTYLSNVPINIPNYLFK